MEYQSFTVSEAAKTLGISPSTLRRWCSDFASYLSEGARPDKGAYRRLLRADLQVLAEVKTFREQGLSVPTIQERLAGVVFQAPSVESASAAHTGAGDAPLALAVVSAVQSALAPYVSRLEALEQGQHAQDAQRLRVDAAWLAVAGFIAGLIVGLAVWWF